MKTTLHFSDGTKEEVIEGTCAICKKEIPKGMSSYVLASFDGLECVHNKKEGEATFFYKDKE